MGAIGYPESSVSVYHYTLRNILEERKCHLRNLRQKPEVIMR